MKDQKEARGAQPNLACDVALLLLLLLLELLNVGVDKVAGQLVRRHFSGARDGSQASLCRAVAWERLRHAPLCGGVDCEVTDGMLKSASRLESHSRCGCGALTERQSFTSVDVSFGNSTPAVFWAGDLESNAGVARVVDVEEARRAGRAEDGGEEGNISRLDIRPVYSRKQLGTAWCRLLLILTRC